ncbi:DUF6064 family protein [Ramlibacter sp.]|uniref:DUF6064 family protein n=1 Tax=Ramlibacter sp. TaxID=1917967 RepID=UPI002FC6A254
MQLPFSIEQFFEIIRNYNVAVWPAQLPLTLLAVGAVALAWWGRAWSARAIWGTLAFLWAWTGVVYQLAFFTSINPAAYAFGALFLLGSAAFLGQAMRSNALPFTPSRDAATGVGLALIAYALVVYPVWSTVGGHAYPDLPTFGLPCPTTIFTIGMLAMVRGGRTWPLFVAPVVWSMIGLQAAFLFGVVPDLGLGVAGLAGIALALRSRGRASPVAHA